jgi:serine/threonine protein phosphatase 1
MIPTNHIHYQQNKVGRDFVVGDLHGCLEDLLLALQILQFNIQYDRLFSCGDLIDRGPLSRDTAELIYADWFHAVRGNHEQMMIDTIVHNKDNIAGQWFRNGGNWALDHIDGDFGELLPLAQSLDELPLVISVGEGKHRFNIVHAELTHHVEINYHDERQLTTNQTIDNWEFTDYDLESMLWGRAMHTSSKSHNKQYAKFQDQALSPTFVGHTSVRENTLIERQIYLDTSAVCHYTDKNKSESNCITIAEPGTNQLHKYCMMWRTITSVGFDTLLVL